MLKLGIFLSGGGTTAEAIIKACQAGRLSTMTPALVISSDPGAGGILRAKQLGTPDKDALIITTKQFASRELFGEAILTACRERGVDIIGQYGWHVKTPENVINAYKGKMINQHPGPLDTGRLDFGGKGMFGRRVHAARLYFVRATNRDFWTEATAHRVEVEYDTGAVIKRKQLEILPSDDPSSLRERLLPIEHEVQIEALEDLMNDCIEEFKREMPLVRSGEEGILEEAKKVAGLLFPNG